MSLWNTSRPPPTATLCTHLYAQARLHHEELVHQLLVQRPHVLRDELFMHGQTKLQNLGLEGARREKPRQ